MLWLFSFVLYLFPTLWPHNIPADLRPRLAAAMTMRSCGPAEAWGEIRDWLEKHGVEMREEIKTERPLDGAQRDQ